jgi:hypothetical protein
MCLPSCSYFSLILYQHLYRHHTICITSFFHAVYATSIAAACQFCGGFVLRKTTACKPSLDATVQSKNECLTSLVGCSLAKESRTRTRCNSRPLKWRRWWIGESIPADIARVNLRTPRKSHPLYEITRILGVALSPISSSIEIECINN